jgi:AbrB family looped-hinge helix DNA binding protein
VGRFWHRETVYLDGKAEYPYIEVRTMAATSTISSKGQITLPMEVRQRLGVGEGDKVEFTFDGQQTVVTPVRSEESPFRKWVGIGRGVFKDEDELLAWERELRGYDEDER